MADIWDIIGAGLNLAGGIAAAGASKDAAKVQAEAARAGQAQFRPYAQLGDYAAGELQGRLTPNGLLGTFNPEALQNEPGYQFRLNEGNKAIDRAAGARGMRYSGATLKGLQRFAQDYASNEYQNAYDRDEDTKTRQYNFLAGPANLGMGASGTIANLGGQGADARAAGMVGASNNIWGGVADAYSGLNQQRYLNQPMVYYVR